MKNTVICRQAGKYLGWPTVAMRKSGELLVVFSGDRDQHVCPFGKVQLVRSTDNGAAWSGPETICNGPVDDRDAGIRELESGDLLVNWFTSTAFSSPRTRESYGDEVVDSWGENLQELAEEYADLHLARWTRRSSDGGRTWEDPVDSIVGSPHGPIQLSDGRLIYYGRGRADGNNMMLGVSESTDDGRSWKLIWSMPLDTDDDLQLCEPHQAELPDGRIFVMMRFNRAPNYLRQTVSEDGGKTWSTIEQTEIWGYPPHLLSLADGRLLVSYGHRREPFGEFACLSNDGGVNWACEEPIVISRGIPQPGPDLGYPASVQLDDESILSVYYQCMNEGEKPSIVGTRWELPALGRGDDD